jgi:hypothetical protein
MNARTLAFAVLLIPSLNGCRHLGDDVILLPDPDHLAEAEVTVLLGDDEPKGVMAGTRGIYLGKVLFPKSGHMIQVLVDNVIIYAYPDTVRFK